MTRFFPAGLFVAASMVALIAAEPASAQFNNVGPRVNPNISVGPRVNIAPVTPNIRPVMPNVRYSPTYSSGTVTTESYDDPVVRRPRPRVISDEPERAGQPRNRNTTPRTATAVSRTNYVPKEVILEITGNPTDAEINALARRHRLTRVESQEFTLTGSRMYRWRIGDNRSVETVIRQVVAGGGVQSANPNYRFTLQQNAAKRVEPQQYAVTKLRLAEAHTLAKGANIVVAVIDSGVDASHPELVGTVTELLDPLGGTGEKTHAHGTGIAGAIVAHDKLMGAAPSAKLLAIRAFSPTQTSAESTSFIILKSLELAAQRNVRIINMSFAGPRDGLIERSLAALNERGIVLIAASGNAGAKSPPLYPAADRNVIAVSAVDANDKLFAASNRGQHIALAAPGADLLLPSPDGKYQVTSGTSFGAAYVSGLAALLLERNPALKPAEIRDLMTRTAQDLGAPGRDNDFGAGRADAFAAVAAASASVANAAQTPAPQGDR